MNNNYSLILADNIERRKIVDKPLINFFLWVLIGIITVVVLMVLPESNFTSVLGSLVGIPIGLYMVYFQTNRVNAFIERKTEWYQNIVEFTNKYSDNNVNLKKLNNLINPEIFNTRMKMINLKNALIILGIQYSAGLVMGLAQQEVAISLMELALQQISFMFLLMMYVFAVVNIIIYEYPINAIWNKIQYFENEFDETLSKVWQENNWIEKPMYFYTDPSKKRNFLLWIFFSIISWGIMAIIWKYKIYTNPDNMYGRFHNREDEILEVISKIEQQYCQQKISETENI